MAPVIQYTPRKDGKTEAQAQADMAEHLETFYVTDNDHGYVTNIRRDTSVAQAPPTTTETTSKRPVRKKAVKAKSGSSIVDKKNDTQSSPLSRKSARLASKRAAKEASCSESDDDQDQPPAKKSKVSAAKKSVTPSIKETVSSPPTEVTSLPSKEASASPNTDVGSSLTTKPSKKLVTQAAPASKKKTAVTTAPTFATKSTGRAAPISKSLRKAKYIEKPTTSSSANDDEADGSEMDEADEQSDTSADGSKTNGKGKQQSAKGFEGTKTGHGTSVEKPEDAPLDEPWSCANRDCNSGQTYHARDGPNSYGRKVISNFFGRNKRETNLIHPDVWHNYCRKCYQRGTYRVNVISAKEKCKFYINNIDMQLDRIQLWRPGALFTVQLSKGAGERLAKYYKERSKQGGNHDSAAAAVTKAPTINAKGKAKPLSLEDGFPIGLMEFFEDSLCKADQNFTDLKLILNWCRNLAENGQIDCMPPMEFLINKQNDEEDEAIDPATNYDRWCAFEDGLEYGENVDEYGIKDGGYDYAETARIEAERAAAPSVDAQMSNSDESDIVDNNNEDEDTESDSESLTEHEKDYAAAIALINGEEIYNLSKSAIRAGAKASERAVVDEEMYDVTDDEESEGESENGGVNDPQTPPPRRSSPPSPSMERFKLSPKRPGSISPRKRGPFTVPGHPNYPIPAKRKARDDIEEDYNGSASSSNGSPKKKQKV